MTASSHHATPLDLLVVGGGMTGLALACAVAGVSRRVLLVERRALPTMAEPPFDGRVTAVARGPRRALEGIGVWPLLAAEAEPILRIRVRERDSPLLVDYDHRDVGDEPLGHIVENRVIRRALLDRAAALPSLELAAPAELLRLRRDPDAVRLELGDGRRFVAPLVAAVDGKFSGLRAAAGIQVTRWDYGQTGLVCTVAHERPHGGTAVERFFPSGPFAILPMKGGHRSSIVWAARDDLARDLIALDDAAFTEELAERFGGFLGRLELAGPRWHYPLSLVMARRLTAERLALLGDAARSIHPIAGQGWNLAVRDVAALAEVVVDSLDRRRDPGGEAALARYERWRRFDGLALIAVTDGLNRLFGNDFPPLRLVRELGLGAVNRLPPLKRLFMNHAMGTLGDLPRLMRGEGL